METRGRKTNYKFEDVYVPIEGYGMYLSRSPGFTHVGYTSPRMKKCRCGTDPVMEQYVDDTYTRNGVKFRNFPAKEFVAICPKCEIRAKGTGTLEECIRRWNAGEFTEDTLMVQERLTYADMNGCIEISNRVISDAVEEAVELVKRKNEEMSILKNPLTGDAQREAHYLVLKGLRGRLKELQRFLTTSPIMFDKDGDAILSGIRRILHPNLTHWEREKIPLNLLKM